MKTQIETGLRAIALAFFAATLAACGSDAGIGSGGNQPGGDPGNGDGSGDGSGSPQGDLIVRLNASNTQLPSDADTNAEGLTLSALITNTDNNTVEDVTVSFTASSGAITTTQATTGPDGLATAVLNTGGDPQERSIVVTARAGDVTDTLNVQVTNTPSGGGLDVANVSLFSNSDTISSGAIGPNDGVTLTALVSDANGNVVPGAPTAFSRTDAQNQCVIDADSPSSDENGTAQATLYGCGTPARTITVRVTVRDDGSIFTDEVDIDVVAGSGPNFASLRLLSSSPELPSSADELDEGITLSAIVADANNNAVSGVDVTFSADSGLLQVTQPTTDQSGTAQAILTTGGDPTNRDIVVTASAQSASDNVIASVSGTQLLLSGPSSLGSGDSGTFIVQLRDSAGAGISGETVSISSAEGFVTPASSSTTTDTSGQVSFDLTGVTGGTDTISVAALSLSASQEVVVSTFDLDIIDPAPGAEIDLDTTQDITVVVRRNGEPAENETVSFSSTRGALSSPSDETDGNGEVTIQVSSSGPGASGPATLSATTTGGAGEQIRVEFVATTAESVDVQATPATVPLTGNSTVRAIVRDADANLVKNQDVDFQLNGVGSISPASGRTNSQGIVTTTYSAPGVSNGTEGVTVSANVRDTATPVTDNAAITVGGEALRIALGTGNLLEEPTTTTFAKPYVVVVSDAAGNPAPPETVFRLQVISIGFITGRYEIQDVDPDPATTDKQWVRVVDQVCPSEDVNENGVLDAGEDINGSGVLEPDNVATVPNTVELDEDGLGFFDISYPQNHNGWTVIRLRATATVSGTETTETVTFTLEGLAEDFADTEVSPPGQTSPYNDSGGC